MNHKIKFGQKKREVLQRGRSSAEIQMGTAGEKAVLGSVVRSYSGAGCILCRLKRQGVLKVSELLDLAVLLT